MEVDFTLHCSTSLWWLDGCLIGAAACGEGGGHHCAAGGPQELHACVREGAAGHASVPLPTTDETGSHLVSPNLT